MTLLGVMIGTAVAERGALAASTGTALWRSASPPAATPRAASWDGAAFGAGAATASVGNWRIIAGAEAPARDEIIAVGVDADSSTIDGELWNGSAWSALPFNHLATVTGASMRGFDVAYESTSGDAVLVWNNGGTGTTGLSYRTWDGSSWSAEATITTPLAGEPQQMRLAADPASDRMVLVVSNAGSEDYCLVWDGSSWGNAQVLSTPGMGDDRTDVFAAYEQKSGKAMVGYGMGTTAAHFRTWDGSAWSAEDSLSAPPGETGTVRWLSLAPDPTSNHIALAAITTAGHAWLSVWNGSAWESAQEATAALSGQTFPAIGVAFGGVSGGALAAYGEGDGTVRYRTWSSGGGWSAQQLGPDLGGAFNALTLDGDPHSDAVMLLAQTDAGGLEDARWSGSSWGSPGELEPSTSESGHQPFRFVWTLAPADLGVSMAVDDATPNVGGTVTFTVTLRNHGPDAASGVAVTDLLPAGLTYASSTPSQGSYVSGTGVWTVGAVASGGTATLSLAATVDAGTVGTTLTNQAQISATDQVDPIGGNDRDSVGVTVESADLAVTMAVDDPTPNEGSAVTYTVTLRDNGPDAAGAIDVTDLLPAGLTFVSSTPSQGSYVSGTGVWTVGAVASGGTATLSLAATVDAGTAGTTITNKARVTASDHGDPAAGNDRDSVAVTVESADLAVTMTVDQPTPNEGDALTFTVTLRNNGPDAASGVAVTDLLPAGLTYSSSTPSQGSYVSGTGVWTVGAVASGGTATLSLAATVDAGTAGTTVTNKARVTASDHGDPVAANDRDSVAVTVQSADLAVTMSVDQPTPNEGDALTFTVTLRNNGPDAASGVAVTDLLPAGLTYTSSTPSQGSYVSGTGVWTVGAVASGTTKTLALVATVNAGTNGTTITNKARVSAAAQADPVAGNDRDSVAVTVQSADLAVTMAVDDGTPNVGGTVTFTVTVHDDGPDAASGVAVTDLLPAGLTYTSSTPSQGSYVSGTGVWTVGAVANGGTATLSLAATVAAGTAGTTLTNRARVSAAAQVDPVSGNDRDSVAVTVESADLAVTMAVDDATPNVGGAVTYTVTLRNHGPDAAGGITVTDLLPAGLTFVSSTPSQGSYVSGSGVWTVGSLANGGTVTLSLAATVAAGTAGTTLTNKARVTASDHGDPVSGNDRDSVAVTVESADLAVTMAVDDATPNVGGAVTYTVTLRNHGPDAAGGIAVTDLLPAGLTFVSSTPSQGSYLSGTGVWTVGSLANGGTVTLSLAATVAAGTAGTTLTNKARVTASDHGDPVSGNDRDSVAVTVESADLAVTVTVDKPTPNEGDALTYTVTLHNNGPDAASGVAVTDLLPAGLTYTSSTPSQGSYVSGTGVWTVGAVASGTTKTLTLRATVNAGTNGTTITNQARVTASDHGDPVPGNDRDSVAVRVLSADLAVTVTVDKPTPNEGDALTYTVTLHNNGPDAASGVAVTDLLPAGLTYTSSTPSQGSYVSGTGVWTVGAVASGTTKTLTLRATVNAGTNGTSITNQALVSAVAQADPVPGNNRDSVTVTVQSADLAVTMSVDKPTPNEGDALTYTVTLRNHGPDAASGVAVTDLLPAGLTYTSSTPSQGSYVSGTGVWTVGSVSNGGVATLSLVARVNAGTAGTSILDKVRVSAAAQADPVAGNNRDSVAVTIPSADLAVAMAVDHPSPRQGDALTYTVTLRNNGPDAAAGIGVTDLLPAGLTYASSTPSQGSYVSGTGVWTVGGLANGSTATLALVATVNAGTAGSTITNKARVSAATQGDPVAANNRDSVAVTVIGADLALTKAVDKPLPNERDTITYTVTLRNNGPSPTGGIGVTDLLPSGVTYVSDTPSQGTYVSGTGAWTVGTLSSGGTVTLRLLATVNAGTAGTSITNTASVTAANEVDPVATNNRDSVTVRVPSADLSVTLAVNNATPNVGTALTYTVTLRNNGPDGATGVKVTDLLPAGLTYSSSTPSRGTYVSGTGVWTVGSLASATTVTLSLVATVNAGTGGSTILDRAAVTAADQVDPVPGNNRDSVSVRVLAADLALTITVDNQAPVVGDVLTYTITLHNNGPDGTSGLKVGDLLPTGLSFISDNASHGGYVPGSGKWTIGGVVAGGTETLVLVARVTSGPVLTNTAAVTSSDLEDPVSTNNSSSTAVTVSGADLDVTMVVDRPAPSEGDALTYTVTLVNHGPHPTTGVVLTDVLPAGLTYRSSAPSKGTYTSGTGRWTVGSMAIGATATLGLVATVDPGTAGTTISNIVAVTASDSGDGLVENNRDTVSVTVQSADLAVTMAVDQPAPNEGAPVTYTVTLRNLGPDPASGVAVTDPLPAGLAYASSAPSQGSYASGTGVWTVGTVPSDSAATLSLVATVGAGTNGTTLTNKAWISAAGQVDLVAGNNRDSVAVTVQSADLGVTMAVDDASPNMGGAVTYTVTLHNLGPDAASGIGVTDPLPAGLTYTSSAPSQGSYVSGSGVWTVGSLASGSSATLGLVATVDAGTAGATIVNTARISAADQADPSGGNGRDSVAVTVERADLAVTLGVDDATPNAGGAVTYTVTLRNNGPDATGGIAVTDALPAGLTFASGAPSQGSYASGSGAWTVGSLASGGTATLGLAATVDLGTAGTTLTDLARVTASDHGDLVPGNDRDSVAVTVESADLAVAMAVDDATPNQGGALTYTVTLHNNGPDLAGGITVTDLLPAGLGFASSAPSQGSYASGTGVWTVGSLANGGTATLSLAAAVAAGTAGTTITNQARVTATDHGDPVSGNDRDSVAITVESADLAMTMAVDDPTPNVGGVVDYTVTLRNNGPDAAGGVAVTDLLPAGLTYASSAPSQGSYASGTGVWTVGAVASGGTATLSLAATLDPGTAGTTITNHARVTATDHGDPVAGNDRDSVAVAVQSADLAVTMAVSDATPNEGAALTFTVTLRNNGPDAASQVAVTDALPAGLTYVSSTPSQGSYASGTGVWTVGAVASGSTKTLSLAATVNAATNGTTITNKARVSAVAQADPVAGNDRDSVAVTVQSADLALTVAVDRPTPNVGDALTFTVTLHNNGPDAASGVAVTDLLPAGLTFTSSAPSQGSYTSGTGLWAVGAVSSGSTVTLGLAAVAGASLAGTTVTDRAQVSATDQGDPVAANDRDSVAVAVQGADLALTMAVDKSTPNEGDTLTFTVTLRNNGPDPATGVGVADLLPVGLTYLSSAPSQGSYLPGTGAWTVGGLANGNTATLALVATVNTGTNGAAMTNLAMVTAAGQADPVPGNQRDSITVAIQGADLAVTVAVDHPGPNVADTVGFTVTLTNHGAHAATGVAVTDLVPAGLTYRSSAPSQGSYVAATGVWTAGAVSVGSTATLALVATVDAGTSGSTITNRAIVTASDQADPDPANNRDSVAVAVQSADLAVTVAVDHPTPNERDTLDYTVTLRNLGPSPASGVIVTDLLPAGLTYRSSVPSAGGYVPATGAWTVGNVPSGTAETLALVATVDAGTNGTTIVDRAAVTASGQGDPVAANDRDSATVRVLSADLAVTMSVTPSTLNVLDTLSYTVTLANHGPDAATGVAVTDLLPAGLTYKVALVSQGGYVPASGVWTVGSVASGGTAILALVAKVDAAAAGTTITNRARVTAAGQGDPVAGNDRDSATVAVRSADLAVTTSVDRPTPNERDTVTFTVTLANNGPDSSTGVAVTDLLPPGVTFRSSAPSQGAYAPGSGVWTVGSVPPASSATLGLTATVDAGTAGSTFMNRARVTAADQGDLVPGNDRDSVTVRVRNADLAVTMAVDRPTPNERDTVTYTVTLGNGGPDSATGVAISDRLPTGLGYRSSAASQGSYSSSTGAWTVGSVAPGSTSTLTLVAMVDVGTHGSTLTNTAAVSASDQGDTGHGNDRDSVAVTIQSADLAVTVAVDHSLPNERDTLTFTVTLRNHGPSAATGAAVTDHLPAGLTLVSGTASQGSYASGAGAWTVGSVANGGAATLALVATVDPGTNGSTLLDVARVSAADQADPAGANDRDSAAVTVASADLAVTVTANGTAPGEGSTIAYTVTVTNAGPQAATGVALTDRLPAGLTYRLAVPNQGSYAPASGVWAVGGLARGVTALLGLIATVDPGTAGSTITNGAAVTAADQGDPVAGNNGGSVDIHPVPGSGPGSADLEVMKTVDLAQPLERDSIAYTVTVTNHGPDPGTLIDVLDLAPAGVQVRSSAASQGAYVPGTGLWSVGSLAGGASATLVVHALVDSGTGGSTIVNTASVASVAESDPVSANNSHSAPIVVQSADLAVSVSVDRPAPFEGDAVDFTVSLANAGPSEATRIRVLDLLPAGLAFRSATASRGTYTLATGTWAVDSLAPSGSATLTLSATVGAGTAGSTILDRARVAALDQADPAPANDSSSAGIVVQIPTQPGQVVAAVDALPATRLVPGAAAGDVLRLSVVNQTAAVETLTAVTVTARTAGTGTPGQLDADWQPVSLIAAAGSASPRLVGTARITAGKATFTGLALVVAPADTARLTLESGASLTARDGDLLDLEAEGPSDLAFAPSVAVAGAWPLDPAGSFTVDGMSAAQIATPDVGQTRFLSGSTRNLALAVLVPANGYAPDVMTRLNVLNEGSAQAGPDVARMEVWTDANGNGRFDPAADSLMGAMLFTGNRWELTGMSVPLPATVFVTCDVTETATEGRTMRLALPTSPDVAIGVVSGNDGPIDARVEAPSSQTISQDDRVVMTAVPVGTGTASPGSRGLTVLHLIATNGYDVTKTLSSLTLTNATTGAGTPAQLDAEISRLSLRVDGNGDGVLGDFSVDPLVGTAFFTGAHATFTGLARSLDPRASLGLFVTMDVSPTAAADGDRLDASVSGPTQVTFADNTAVTAGWPLDSGPGWVIDGMLAAQIGNLGSPVATVGPNQGPILALDAIVPRNGYVNDVLDRVTLENAGTAAATDLSEVRLWRDGGDGVFDAGTGDDRSLGAMSYADGAWVSASLTDSLAAGGARLFASIATAATVTDTATVRLKIPLLGIRVRSSNSGPIDAPVTNPNEIRLSTSVLLASLDLSPAVSTGGQTVTARMRLRNVGVSTIASIAPSSLAQVGTGSLSPLTGPQPATLDLAPGATGELVWTFRADSAGTVELRGAASGIEQGTGLTRSSLVARSNLHQVFVQTHDLDLFSVGSMPFAINRGQTQVVPLSLTFTNAGAAAASDISLRGLTLRLEGSGGGGIVPAALLSRVVVNEGTNVYLDKTTLEATGSTIDLTLAKPVLIESGGESVKQVTLSLTLDVLGSTAVPNFRVVIDNAASFAAEDATSGAPVTIHLAPDQSYPIQSGLARIVAQATGLVVDASASAPVTAGRGQRDVTLIGLSLVNPGLTGLGSDVRLSSLAVDLVDAAGMVVKPPSRVLSRIAVHVGAQTFVDRGIGAADDSTLSLAFSSLLSIPAAVPTGLTVTAAVSDSAQVGAYRLRLADSTTVDARDANTGSIVPVTYDAHPTEGAPVRIQTRADSVLAMRMQGIPPAVPVGAKDVTALEVALRHPGPGTAGSIDCGSLTLLCRGAFGEPLVPSAYLQRVRLLMGGSEVGLLTNVPSSGGEITIPLTGVAVAPGQVDSLEIRIDVEVTAPATQFQMMVPASGIDARDANLGTATAVGPDRGAEFPLASGLTQLQSPARGLTASFIGTMPAALAPDGSVVPVARLTLHNTAPANGGVIRLDHLRLMGADRAAKPMPLGAAAARVQAFVGDSLWADTGALADTSVAPILAAAAPLVLGPDQAVALDVRVTLRAGGKATSLRVGCDAAGIGVVQPDNPLLSVGVVAASGQSFPFWTEVGNFSGLSLAESYANFPNPFAAGREETRFAFNLERPARVSLVVWTARGGKVRTLMDGVSLGQGLHQSVAWDGRNGVGQTVLNGVYFAEIQVAYDDGSRQRALRKVAVAR